MNRTRLFAMPMGSDQFYEFTALSMSSSDSYGVVEVETDIADWKYIKRMRKGAIQFGEALALRHMGSLTQ